MPLDPPPAPERDIRAQSGDPLRFTAATTYNAAADHYDCPALGFWQRHGEAMVAMLAPRPGQTILDVGCGTGASALPAAKAVGLDGRVTGIDIAGTMLARAEEKAVALDLDNASFQIGDMAASGFPDENFDIVISVFSIFFVPDMESQLTELWRMVRPGGQLGLATWSANAFQPCAGIFQDEVSAIAGTPPPDFRPWERVEQSEMLRSLFVEAGASTPDVRVVEDRQPLTRADDWWTIALGSGFRADIERLEPSDREKLRSRVRKRIFEAGITSIKTTALHAIALKPG